MGFLSAAGLISLMFLKMRTDVAGWGGGGLIFRRDDYGLYDTEAFSAARFSIKKRPEKS